MELLKETFGYNEILEFWFLCDKKPTESVEKYFEFDKSVNYN